LDDNSPLGDLCVLGGELSGFGGSIMPFLGGKF
jgi:hypothetical protein